MFRGFKIDLNIMENQDFWSLYAIGEKIYQQNSNVSKAILDQFVRKAHVLDGSAMQNEWFPQVEADVFISHSHKDKNLAIVLAGWLQTHFHLTSFIDSTIWGYSNRLLKSIDDEYCWNPDRGVYDYGLRNQSTAHVHMMLSTALSMMIDKCECLFFLNTPNSIKSFGSTDKTDSPWIYSEITATQILRQKFPTRITEMMEAFSHFDGLGDIEKSLKITYDVNLTNLVPLGLADLDKWQNSHKKHMHGLDSLYNLFPPVKEESKKV